MPFYARAKLVYYVYGKSRDFQIDFWVFTELFVSFDVQKGSDLFQKGFALLCRRD